MSGLDDLGRALRDDAAANAPRASAIDVDAVTRAARARRTPRVIGVGTLALVGVLGLGSLAVGALAPPVLIAASESQNGPADASTAEGADLEALDGGGAPAQVDDPLGCGTPAPADLEADERVRVELALPMSAPVERDATHDAAVGTLRLVNASTADLIVQSAPGSFAVLLRNDVVVGQPSTVGELGTRAALEPGASLDLGVRLLAVSCVDGSALPPGDYTVLVSAEIGVDGEEPVRLTAPPVTVRIG